MRLCLALALVVASGCAREAGARSLRERLLSLEGSLESPLSYRALDLLARLEHDEYLGLISHPLIELDVQSLERGRDPDEGRRRGLIKGVRSPVDGSIQPYLLNLPADFDGRKKLPLVLQLHFHGWTDWFRPFQFQVASYNELREALVATPHARGSADYMYVAEKDILATMDAIAEQYPVDLDRVYLTGYSMGGTGSWNLAVRYPERFAAIYPVCGNADYKAWEEAWDWRGLKDTPLAPLRTFLRENTCPVTFAENLMHVPVACYHGALDSIAPVGHSRSMVGRLKELSYGAQYTEPERLGHVANSLAERYGWLSRHRRAEPSRVRLKSSSLKYGKAYWLRIDSLERYARYAELEAEIREGAFHFKKAWNVRALSFLTRAPRARAVFEGQEVLIERGRNGWGSVRRERGRWTTGAAPPGGKTAALEGPVEDAFASPFLLVYGTGGRDELLRRMAEEEARSFAREWKKRYGVCLRVARDGDVGDAEVERFNLILYGPPGCNSLSSRVSPRLPLKLEGEKVLFSDGALLRGPNIGLKLCYPNPLNPRKYVVLFASPTWKGMFQINKRFGNWFDWIVYDNRAPYDYCVFDDLATIPETYLEFGFFGPDWELDPETRFKGVRRFRSRAVSRRYPRHLSPPEGAKSLHLSELMPALIDTTKGPVVFDRSFEGNVLRIGEREFEKGLGVRPMSRIEWDIGGRFKSFRVLAGIDLEGASSVNRERAAVERVDFLVMGDGRVLGRARGMRWNTPPHEMRLKVAGVRRLSLEVRTTTPQGWLYGSVAWAEPVLEN